MAHDPAIIITPEGRSDKDSSGILFRFIRNAIDNHSHLDLNSGSGREVLGTMYVCICNAITDKQIRDAAEAGIEDLWALQASLGVATNCGSCAETAEDILREARGSVDDARNVSKDRPEPRTYVPAPA